MPHHLIDPNRLIMRYQRFKKRWIDRQLYGRHRAPTVVGGAAKPPPLPRTYQQAAISLRADISRTRLSELQMRADPAGTHPDIVKFSRKLIAELSRRGIPFYAFEYKRSLARQAELYAQGRTTSGPKVTNAKAGSSAHNFGLAVDLIHATRLWDLTKKEWDLVGSVGKEIARKMNLKIVWGGDWTRPYDPAHWQVQGWRNHLDWDRGKATRLDLTKTAPQKLAAKRRR